MLLTLFALPSSCIIFVCLVVCFLINLDILQLILQSSEPGRGFLRGKQLREIELEMYKNERIKYYDFGCLDCPEKTISELSLMLPSKPRFHCDL